MKLIKALDNKFKVNYLYYTMDNPTRIHTVSMMDTTSKKEVYNIWSDTYDTYVAEQKYTGPQELVKKLSTMIMNFKSREIEVLDFGCGTGLVGQEIRNQGISVVVDGLDLSPKMLERAAARECYRNLWELNLMEENITEDLLNPDNVLEDKKTVKLYPVIVSCGVFLEGHAPLEIIDKLVDHLQIEGFLLFTIRDSYLEKEGEKVRKFVTENPRLKVLEKESIAYLENVECSMFLVYRNS